MTKRDVVTKADVEIYYKQCRKIKFKGRKKKYDLTEIFDKMCRVDGRNTAATVQMRDGYHCNVGKVRSLDDILNLAKYYQSEMTVKEVIIELCKYKDGDLLYSYCPNIKKFNFMGRCYYGGFAEKLGNLGCTTLGFPRAHFSLAALIA